MAKKHNRSGFLFMLIIFLLFGIIIYTYKDKFYVLFNTGVSSGKKIINEKFDKKDTDKIAKEKIDLLNKEKNKSNDNNEIKEKIFENIDDIKNNVNNLKEKVSNNNEKNKKENIEIIKNDKIENTKTEKITKKETNNIKEIDKDNNIKTHNRNSKVYFSKLTNDEKLILVSVKRNISYINTPLTETIKTLLAGPNYNEKSSALITNIPNQTKLISVAIKNNTAYINFSNEFEFNSFGKDATIAQLQQVVYTATEFTNVKYVQILINGKIKKYLGGEGVIIEKPFSRSDFS